MADRLDDDRWQVFVSALMTNTTRSSVSWTGRSLRAPRAGDRGARGSRTAHSHDDLSQQRTTPGRVRAGGPAGRREPAALPADWVYEYYSGDPRRLGSIAWLVLSLALLGRFAEAGGVGAEATRLTEATGHAVASGGVLGAGSLRLCEGAWARRPRIEAGRLVRTGDVGLLLPAGQGIGVGPDGARRGEGGADSSGEVRLLEACAGSDSSPVRRRELPCFCRAVAARAARRGAEPGRGALNALSPGPGSRPMRCTCRDIATHPDRSTPGGEGPLPSGAAFGRAARRAAAHRPLPPRPRALCGRAG